MAGLETPDRLCLQRVGHHLHQLDAVAIRVLNPGLHVPVRTKLLGACEWNSCRHQLRHGSVDAVDLEIQVVEAVGLTRWSAVTGCLGEHFKKLEETGCR